MTSLFIRVNIVCTVVHDIHVFVAFVVDVDDLLLLICPLSHFVLIFRSYPYLFSFTSNKPDVD